jgi:hypothetical protein
MTTARSSVPSAGAMQIVSWPGGVALLADALRIDTDGSTRSSIDGLAGDDRAPAREGPANKRASSKSRHQ